jgi:DNA modification methylase
MSLASAGQGDIWQLARHRLICGDAQDASVYAALLEGTKIDAIFTDPYSIVPTDGHVPRVGEIKVP